MNCKKHNRYNCYDYECRTDNAGQMGINSSGDMTLGLGSGLTMDMSDGSIGFNLGGGFSMDTN